MENATESLFSLLNKRGYTEAVFTEARRLIDAGANVNYRQERYPFETILCRALDDWDEVNVLHMVQLLVKHGADVNLPADIFSPLWFATQKNYKKVCEFLLDKGIEETDDAMKLAIEKNHIEIVRLFLQKGIDANPAYHGVASFLNACCEAYRCRDTKTDELPGLETARLLLAAGAGPNGEDCEGASPFKNAIVHNFLALADLLLEYGADIESDDGHPASIFCAQSKESINYLISKGALCDSKNHYGMDRFSCAIQQSDIELIPFLIEKGVDFYSIDHKGYTPLHHAIIAENTKILKLLLPFYDLQKANQIFPIDELSQNKSLRELLGLAVADTASILEPEKMLDYCQTNPLFLLLKESTEILYEKILTKNVMIDSYLMPWDALLLQTIPQLYEDLVKTGQHWNRGPLQAVYLEYAGSIIKPFDANALSWGYSKCDDALKANNTIFAEMGGISFDAIYENIEELHEHFTSLYGDIHQYLNLVASLHLHIAFSHFVKSEIFNKLSITKPFYLFGNEHDYDPVLIYKLPPN